MGGRTPGKPGAQGGMSGFLGSGRGRGPGVYVLRNGRPSSIVETEFVLNALAL